MIRHNHRSFYRHRTRSNELKTYYVVSYKTIWSMSGRDKKVISKLASDLSVTNRAAETAGHYFY